MAKRSQPSGAARPRAKAQNSKNARADQTAQERTAKPAKEPRAAFPKKNQPPTDAEFAARLPLPVGRKLEALRAFLKKQKGVEESWHYYGPKAGWAYRYLRGEDALATILLHGGTPTAVVALDAETQEAIPWDELSPAAQTARKVAHGSPALLWLDLPLDGTGGGDLRKLVRAKLTQITRREASAPRPGRGAAEENGHAPEGRVDEGRVDEDDEPTPDRDD